MKYLIVGLGNIGKKYEKTRHNIGFIILDAFTKISSIVFIDKHYGSIAEIELENKKLFICKPSTYMNLSGYAIRYWLQKENIPIKNLLILVDDLSLPFGCLRLKSKGSSAGHNGLKNIQAILETKQYPRLRFGIGGYFFIREQIQYVLGTFSNEEQIHLPERIEKAIEIIYSFCIVGIDKTMNLYNNQ